SAICVRRSDCQYSIPFQLLIIFTFFFFQAEDGIRDFHVTGVQTCALPIYDITSPTPLEDMIRNMERMRAIPGSMLGMFYHPYLGLEPLIPVIEHLETFPDLQWLDLTELVDPDLISIIHQASLNPLIALRIGVADF